MCSTAEFVTCHGVAVASTRERPSYCLPGLNAGLSSADFRLSPCGKIRKECSQQLAPSFADGRFSPDARIQNPGLRESPSNRPVPAPLSRRDKAPMPRRSQVERTRRNPAAGLVGPPLAGSPEPASRCLPARICLHLSLEPADTSRNHQNEDKVFENKNRVDFQWPVLRNDQLVGLSREFLHSDHRDQ